MQKLYIHKAYTAEASIILKNAYGEGCHAMKGGDINPVNAKWFMIANHEGITTILAEDSVCWGCLYGDNHMKHGIIDTIDLSTLDNGDRQVFLGDDLRSVRNLEVGDIIEDGSYFVVIKPWTKVEREDDRFVHVKNFHGLKDATYIITDPLARVVGAYPNCPNCGNAHAMMTKWDWRFDDVRIDCSVCRDCGHVHMEDKDHECVWYNFTHTGDCLGEFEDREAACTHARNYVEDYRVSVTSVPEPRLTLKQRELIYAVHG